MANVIKAYELRLGNSIRHNGNEVEVTIDLITHCSRQPDHFSGIPLTPELLLMCGFEYNDIAQYWVLHSFNDVYFAYGKEGNFCMYPECEGGNQIGKEIQYLHELQNLHLDLTGKQLKM